MFTSLMIRLILPRQLGEPILAVGGLDDSTPRAGQRDV